MSYLCVRIAEFPVQALISLRPEMRHQPLAVFEHELPLERVCALNALAAQTARHGITRVELEDIVGIVSLRRSLSEEQSLRNSILALLGQYTPRMEDMSTDYVCCVALDLSGTERLNGTSLEVAARIEQQLRQLHLEAVICISANVNTALVFARTLRLLTAPMLVPVGRESASLAPLSLDSIEPDAEQAETFARWGIGTLGQLAALPLNELIARMGQPAKRLHELATGTHPHIFCPLEPAFALQAHAVFEDAVEIIDSLLFVLGPMLDRLIALAETKALALLSVELTLKLEKAVAHTISVRPALPSTDRTFLLKLLQLELAAHPPSAAVVALDLSAEPAPPTKEQGGLFSPQLPDASRLDVTLARIQSIVGVENVGSPQLKDTHAPEGFTMVPFQVLPQTAQHIPPVSHVRTACRRFRPPWPARVSHEDFRPSFIACDHQRFRVMHAYGPWYSSGEWWSSGVWAREEWEVILRAENAPMPLHALLVHDLATRAWKIEGMYD